MYAEPELWLRLAHGRVVVRIIENNCANPPCWQWQWQWQHRNYKPIYNSNTSHGISASLLSNREILLQNREQLRYVIVLVWFNVPWHIWYSQRWPQRELLGRASANPCFYLLFYSATCWPNIFGWYNWFIFQESQTSITDNLWCFTEWSC